MEYNKIIAVTGLPGLYELLSSKSDGAIVRSLEDKSTRFVSSRIHNFSHLESIEVYTVRDNVNLVDILKAMEASNEKLPDDKDNSALRNYFGKVYPDLDFDRVYSSDLKKMVKWFVVLKANDIEIKLSEPEAEVEAEAEEVEEVKEPKTPKAPKEKTAPKTKPEPTGKTEAPGKKEKAEKTEKPAVKKTEKAAAAEKSTAKKSAAPAKKSADSEKKTTAAKTGKSTKKKSEK